MAFACRWCSRRRDYSRTSLDRGVGFVQRDLLHVGQEAVAAPSHRLDVAGMGRGVIESAPNLVDGAADVVIEINEGPLRPETLAELLAGHHLAWLRDQRCQQPERPLLQLNSNPTLTQLTASRVDHEDTKLVGRSRLARACHTSCAFLINLLVQLRRRRV